MGYDFSQFKSAVDTEAVKKAQKEQGQYENVPKGKYVCSLEKMELTITKQEPKRPMFTMSMKVKEGEYKGRLLFFNRVLLGNRKTERWGDAQAIASVVTILEKFGTQTVPEFTGDYEEFADCIADIYEELQGNVEIEVEYDADSFNTITFKAESVFDLA